MAKNVLSWRNGVKGATLGALKLNFLSFDNNFSLKLFYAFIMLGCSGMLRPSDFTVKKTQIVLDLGAREHFVLKSLCSEMFMKRYWKVTTPIINQYWWHFVTKYIQLSWIFKKLWSNILIWSPLIAEGGIHFFHVFPLPQLMAIN